MCIWGGGGGGLHGGPGGVGRGGGGGGCMGDLAVCVWGEGQMDGAVDASELELWALLRPTAAAGTLRIPQRASEEIVCRRTILLPPPHPHPMHTLAAAQGP
jgi:hypothetical protein